MSFGKWGFPTKKVICDSCESLEYDDNFKTVRTNKKILITSDREAKDHLPLMMLDDAKKEYQLYFDLKSLRQHLDKFDEKYRASNIRIIERQYRNLNDYFL